MSQETLTRWSGKVVLVTGASSGLGKAVAREFAARGAKVVLAARSPQPLEEAAQQIEARGGAALPVPADVTSDQQVAALLEAALGRFGRLDVLVNAAGRSARQEILTASPQDFQDLMELNFYAVVRCTRAAALHLLETGGHVVNIGSLSSKFATRYLGAYPATKFALAAYTQQLRLELGPRGLHVLLVCPGPIARDEVRTYGAEQVAGLPPSAAKPGAGARVKAIRPELLAEKIIRACERRQGELVVPGKARLLAGLMQLWPSLGEWLLRKMTE
jgi:NAD(P)-dependent dehydrogenase (short-subunit alcohol dehydrogenase family)